MQETQVIQKKTVVKDPYKRKSRVDKTWRIINDPHMNVTHRFFSNVLDTPQKDIFIWTGHFSSELILHRVEWDFVLLHQAGTGAIYGTWALVKTNGGYSPTTLNIATDGNSTYTPEQEVIAFGNWAFDSPAPNGREDNSFRGSTNTKRILTSSAGGTTVDDRIFLCFLNSSGTSYPRVIGTVTLYTKTT